jgi:hypothetical protein
VQLQIGMLLRWHSISYRSRLSNQRHGSTLWAVAQLEPQNPCRRGSNDPLAKGRQAEVSTMRMGGIPRRREPPGAVAERDARLSTSFASTGTIGNGGAASGVLRSRLFPQP